MDSLARNMKIDSVTISVLTSGEKCDIMKKGKKTEKTLLII